MITILGSGGHGWRSLESFIENQGKPLNIYNLTVDYGGSGGIWYRLLEHNNYEMNLLLDGIVRPVLPWGDFNKFLIQFYTKKYGSLVGQVLDFRSDDYESHRANFDILSDRLVLEHDVHEAFWAFFTVGFNYYLSHRDELGYDYGKGFCMGYPWQDYVYWNLGGVADVNKYYAQKGIIPAGMKLKFTAPGRQILKGVDIEGKPIEGEDEIDNHPTPMDPYKLEIFDLDGSKAEPDENLLNDLKESEYVIVPNGSMANWVPLLNQEKIVGILKDKRVIWLLNPTHTKNEVELTEYIKFVRERGLNPLMIGPKTPVQVSDLAQKTNFTSENIEQFKSEYGNAMELVLEIPNDVYNPEQVESVVGGIMH